MFHLYNSHPSSFDFTPRRPQFELSGPSAASPFSYEDYDLQRSIAEHEALARRQQRRREVEEATLLRRRREIALEHALREREAQRLRAQEEERQALAYQAALRQVAEARERQRVAELVERKKAYIKQRQYEALIEKRIQQQLEARQAQAQAAHLHAQRVRQAQAARAQAARHKVPRATTSQDSGEAEEFNPIEFFFKVLIGHEDSGDASTAASAPTFPSTSESTTKSTPAATSVPTTEESSAAATLQRHFRAHQLRRENLSTLASLNASFESHQSNLVLPASLVFRPSPPSSVNGDATASTSAEALDATPQLAYAPSNSPFLAHEDFLVSLLSKIDAIESGGDKIVKKARKELVKKIEAELTKLDTRKDEEWKKVGSESGDHAAEGKAQEEVAAQDDLTVEKEAEVAEDVEHPLSTSDDEDEVLPPLIDALAGEATSSQSEPATTSTEPEPAATPTTPLTEANVTAVPPQDVTASVEGHESDSDDSSSTHTLSDEAVNDAVETVLRAAEKLGEEVIALEHAELPVTKEVEHIEVAASTEDTESESEGEEEVDPQVAEKEGFVVV